MKRKPLAPPPQPIVWPRANPEALRRFDPSSKVCDMNCGPSRDDQRTAAERKFLCTDCLEKE